MSADETHDLFEKIGGSELADLENFPLPLLRYNLSSKKIVVSQIFIAAADHIEIGIVIIVCVEKYGVDIFAAFISVEKRGVGEIEISIALL